MALLRPLLRLLGIVPSPQKNYAPNVANFFAAVKTIAVDVGQGSYAFTKPGGGCLGFAQFIIESDRKLTFHRLWTREPGNGNGAMMLRALCDLADRYGVELALKVIPIGRKPYPMSREELKVWYQRYGFEGAHWKLIRKPGSQTPCALNRPSAGWPA